jgi:hypothetical protein
MSLLLKDCHEKSFCFNFSCTGHRRGVSKYRRQPKAHNKSNVAGMGMPRHWQGATGPGVHLEPRAPNVGVLIGSPGEV